MRKITNREEANQYYKVINSGVDEFSNKTKARPSEVHKYLSRNGKKFLKQLELDDVDGIDKVLLDVLSHKRNLEDDKVITFESFSKINENAINVGKPNVEHEKILADKFNTSLGHIELIDPQMHLFKINDFGKVVYVVIFNKSEILKIKDNFVSGVVRSIKERVIQVGEVNNVFIPSVNFWLSDFINLDLLYTVVESKVTESLLMDYIRISFSSSPYELSSDISFSVFSDHFIWVI